MQIANNIKEIILKNRTKLLRKSPVINNIITSNLKYTDGELFSVSNYENGKISIELDNASKYYKVIYSIRNRDNTGVVKLKWDVGENNDQFSNEDKVVYIRSNNDIQNISFEINSDKPFDIAHLEIIKISMIEYKIFKYKLYLDKINLLGKSQVKNDFLFDYRNGGIREAFKNLRLKLITSDINASHIQNEKYVLSNEKEKILIVVHEAQKAGATLLSMNIIKTIKKITNFEPVIILISGGPLEEEFKKEGKVYSLNQNDFRDIYNEKLLKNIITEIKNMGVKYAICNSVVSALVAKELNNFGIKIITLIHELPTSIYNYNFVTAAEYAKDYSDELVFAANFVKDEYLRNFKANEEKCYVIPQGIYSNINISSIGEKNKAKQRLCNQLNINSDKKIILGCGYGNLRKGVDLFSLVAIEVCKKIPDAYFVWLGGCDQEIKNWINHDLKVQGVDSNFAFVPFVDDPRDFFGGSDIFLLSSREDPFPSVALEAMASYTPVVNFESSGGIQEILSDGKGINVPYLDIEKYTNKVIELLENGEECKSIALKAKECVSQLTPQLYVKKIIELVADEKIRFKDLYKVSVIIPNYNYEGYLEERLSCIINQTYKPYEIIFLDDCSKDNSIKKAQEILEKQDIPFKIIANDTNNGCFRQWIKGIKNSSGDYIWIAEADDKCELNFLEKLVDKFEDDEVNLAYSQSEIIDENSNKVGFVYDEYTKDLSESKWNSDYINNGEAEVLEGIGIKNTIPNASGVVMRKSALKNIENELQDYSIAGDWFTYVYAIKTGKIAFCSDILNYHRRHSKSIISQCEQKIELFIEVIKIKKFIAENFLISEEIKDRFLNHVVKEYERLSCTGYPKDFNQNEILMKMQHEIEAILNEKINKYSYLKNKQKKNILFVGPDLEMGGGQMIVIMLANYLSRFHNVFFYNARPWLKQELVLNMIDSKVTILESEGNAEQLKEYIKKYNIEAVSTNIWWADKITYQAIYDMPQIKYVIGMHGCYEALLAHPDWDKEFNEIVPKMLDRADNIIYVAQKNTEIFNLVEVDKNKIHKVYYGYEKVSIPERKLSELGIEEDSFVFGLVSRAIKEKGWEEAIQAVININENSEKRSHLILIGSSEYELGLKQKYNEYDYIHFIDNLTKPSEWIGWMKKFDVGLLPTYFISETLPCTIKEYLAYGIPTIATNIGDIKYMLVNENTEAGIVLELQNGKVNIDQLSNVMEKLIKDKELYSRLKNGTNELFKQFDIKNFMDEYYRLFCN